MFICLDLDDTDLFPGEKEIMEKILLAIRRGNLNSFEQEIENLSDILSSYKEDYHLDITDILNQRLGDDCETLLHQATKLTKRSNIVWYLEFNV